MENHNQRAIAIVGVGAVLPDAPDAATFWHNLEQGRSSITEVEAERWDPELYFDPDRQAPDKTYSKIGGWVRDFTWSPLEWRLPIPPTVSDAMDRTQKWAIAAAREALADYGYPDRPLNTDRTAVVIGNAMGGDMHYMTALRAYFPEYASELEHTPSFSGLPDATRDAIIDELHAGVRRRFPDITEDTMPGELANIIAGRIANLFDLHGANFIVDAACASAMAAIDAAIEGLEEGDYDAVVTGGVDANMSASTFIKFCKIGALSATGTRPFGDGADGFVMGEGAALFVLKRLADAEAAGDRIYAVIRGLAGASDGKGKGITAPNPVGQTLAVQRAWGNAGLAPDTATYIEGHGTSTKVGDVVEVGSLTAAFGGLDLAPGSLPLGSVKSNIGHLKGAAGAAGLLKATLALHHQRLPPSIGVDRPNPNIDFAGSPLAVHTELTDWAASDGQVRSAGVSAFGFGGTNFHTVLEEYVPGRLHGDGHGPTVAVTAPPTTTTAVQARPPLRGALVVGAGDDRQLRERLVEVQAEAARGRAPAPVAPDSADLAAPFRVAIDYGDADELAAKAARAITALDSDDAAAWRLLANQGVFRGHGRPHQVAFLYTGQGSQYVNMLAELRSDDPLVREVWAEADRVMEPLLGRPLSEVVFVDPDDPEALAEAEEQLKQTEITQPAVLTVDKALTDLLGAHGIRPDMVMGHSLGEYGALVASGALPFAQALEAVSARGREMANVSVDDNGLMAAVFAPLDDIERTVADIDGHVVVANINSGTQSVIGGATTAVEEAVAALTAAGHQAVTLPVSHAFHTSIVAPAAGPLRAVLERLDLEPPHLPTVANVDGRFYPMGPAVVPDMIDILTRQVASPVQFIEGLRTLYDAGARVFVEVGPKRALHGFVQDVLGDEPDVVALFTNHPKAGDVVSFNQALCGLYAAGLGVAAGADGPDTATEPAATGPVASPPARPARSDDRITRLGELFAEFLDQGYEIYSGGGAGDVRAVGDSEPVVITGAALGLPGTDRVFDDDNIGLLLDGHSFIDAIPVGVRDAIVDKHITRLVKSESGGGSYEAIDSPHDVIKLAGRRGQFDIVDEFAIDEDRKLALDPATELAMAAGIDALRDAGLPLVMGYRTTSTGSQLPDGWKLPVSERDDTAVIFASAFPGLDRLVDEVTRYEQDRAQQRELEALEHLRSRMSDDNDAVAELDHMIHEHRAALDRDPYEFDRRFLFKALSMGHSQFAEHVGARGPNTQLNAACASTTQALAVAEDWIRLDRCRRVLIVAGDDVTSDTLLEWIGAGFLSTGAAATDEVVEEAALPFDRRRHGMVLGMGGAAMVVERADAARERGIRPICEVLSTVTANSAFHGSRLDVDHIGEMMEELVVQAEQRWDIDRHQIAAATVFVSHETYTPARGGSAQAEVDALRRVFGASADRIVIANTKGFTGHAMGVGIEDVLAVKALETGIVPPIANVKEVDPDLGALNLSRGGAYPITYALRLGAGFGSQISLSLTRWVPSPDGSRVEPDELGHDGRIADQNAWAQWVRQASGYDAPGLEIDHRTLRVRDDGPPSAPRAPVSPGEVEISVPVAVAEPVPAPVAEPEAVAESVAVPVAEPVVEPGSVLVGGDPVVGVVLGIVSEQTGYPSDMLDLDLDLEADLGIDTVKQADTFAAIRERYGIERDESLSLRDYPTLASVIGFVHERAEGLDTEPEAVAESVAVPVAEPVVEPGSVLVGGDPVVGVVLGIVSEQTGYPSDMLDLDLDLEADLGIDTVKQADTFAAIRERYGIERDESLSLRDYPTLASVIGFVHERAEGLDTEPEPVAESVPVAGSGSVLVGGDPVVGVVLGIVSEQTGYPSDMLDLDLDLEADLGIDTVKQADTFAAIRERYGIERDESLSLRDYPTLASVIGFVHERAEGLDTEPEPVAESVAGSGSVLVGGDPVVGVVLGIVSEQTGYPSDMLDLDLDLEADLGIDTVKQADTFAAIRERYGIERDESLSLRDYPTLASVIGFVHERAEGLDTEPEAVAESLPVAEPEAASVALGPRVLGDDDAAAAVPRRIPVPTLRPDLDQCVPTGIELAAGDRVIVLVDAGGVGSSLVDRLTALGVDVFTADGTEAADELLGRVDEWRSGASVTGIYWLAALDVEPALDALDLGGWREELHRRVKLLYRTLRDLGDGFGSGGTFLVTATRLGGLHGYGPDGATAPMGGGVVGLAKAFKRECPDALVKAVDLEVSRKTAALADLLVAETMRDPGAVEIGYHQGRRFTISLRTEPLPVPEAGLILGPDSVFVVTGAAGSIVSAIVADLARASGGTFHLLDRVPEPDPHDPDLAAFTADPDGLKRTIFERLSVSGDRVTPVMVDRELAGIERAHEALAALQAVADSGGEAHYHCVDLLDAEAMRAVTDQIVDRHDRIDVVLHAGGLEISRLLGDKEPEEFDLVFDVKADGWFNLVTGLSARPIGATVAFSSVAGRFGNAGQTDYSAANDLLCKHTAHMAAHRPDTLGLALDWTAWGDIGMATRGSIPAVMAAAGIDMLPAPAGIPIVRRELTGDRTTREVVVGLELGALGDEWHPTGGLAPESLAEAIAARPLLGEAVAMTVADGLVLTTTLDPVAQPFLDDHRIDGTPVLPGVMGIELFAQVASVVVDDRTVVEIEDVDFLAPLKFYRDEPRTLVVSARFGVEDDDLVADCVLAADRVLATQDEVQRTVHFTGRVRLGTSRPDQPELASPQRAEVVVGDQDIYRIYFHGPAYQVLAGAWCDDGAIVGELATALPSDQKPPDTSSVTAPRLTELCFQAAGVWEIGTTGALALPTHIDRVRLLSDHDVGPTTAHAVVRCRDDGGFDAMVTDGEGRVLTEMIGYRTVRLPGPIDDELVAPLRAAMVVDG